MELIRHLDMVDQLSRISSPTIILADELDRVIPVAAAEEIARSLPEGTAQLKIIDGACYFTWLNAPDRYWP